MSNHIQAAKGEIAKTVLLPGDPLRAKFIAEHFLEDAKCFNNIRGMLGYTGTYKGKPVSVMGTGMGMPSMGIYSWELINEYGVENLIRIGTSGALSHKVKVRDLVFTLAASTDSNWQHTFGLQGTFAPNCSFPLLMKAVKAANDLGIPFHAGNTFSCDIFYESLENALEPWTKLGVLAVEMEAAALYMNAARYGANALCITTVSNHILTGEETTAEERESTFTDMMKVALEAAIAE